MSTNRELQDQHADPSESRGVSSAALLLGELIIHLEHDASLRRADFGRVAIHGEFFERLKAAAERPNYSPLVHASLNSEWLHTDATTPGGDSVGVGLASGSEPVTSSPSEKSADPVPQEEMEKS